MQFIFASWLIVAGGPLPGAEREAGDRPVVARVQGAALIWCVRAGMGPAQVERLFGSPGLVSRFRDGPEEWWYPEFGVTARFPAGALQGGRLVPQRVQGGIY